MAVAYTEEPYVPSFADWAYDQSPNNSELLLRESAKYIKLVIRIRETSVDERDFRSLFCSQRLDYCFFRLLDTLGKGQEKALENNLDPTIWMNLERVFSWLGALTTSGECPNIRADVFQKFEANGEHSLLSKLDFSDEGTDKP